MALVSLKKPIPFGPVFGVMSAAASVGTVVADANGEGMALIFVAETGALIDSVAFRVSAVVDTPTVDVSIQTLDTSGNPSGTIVGGSSTQNSGTLTATTIIVSGLNAQLVEGTAYAAVIVAAGIGGTDSATLIHRLSDVNNLQAFPHASTNTGAGWVKNNDAQTGCPIALGTSSTAWLSWSGIQGPHTFSVPTYADSSNPDEKGLRFTIPAIVRVTGLVGAFEVGTGGTFHIVMTDASGNDVGSTLASFDTDLLGGGVDRGLTFLKFATPFTTVANTVYVVSVKATSTALVEMIQVDFLNNSLLDAWYSKDWYLVTRQNSTTGSGVAWTDDTASVPLIWPLIDQIHDGASAGGGGMLVHPGMAGGMRG